jgi:general secretion pathway protein I
MILPYFLTLAVRKTVRLRRNASSGCIPAYLDKIASASSLLPPHVHLFVAIKLSFHCRRQSQHLEFGPPSNGRLRGKRATSNGCRIKKTKMSGIAMSSGIACPTQTSIAGDTVCPSRHRAKRSNAGFTLIEVVVALGVVAIVITAIGAVVTTSSRGTRSLEQHLALVETTRIVAATLPKSEQIALDGLSGEILGHRWRVGISPFVGSGINQVAGSPWIPQTVVVRVRSPSGAVYGFETVRLQPRVVQ